MKLFQGILLAALLAVVLIFSACFGPSAAERAQQEDYRQALETYQKQMEEYNKQTEEYNQKRVEALQEYLNQWQLWQQQQIQQAIEVAPAAAGIIKNMGA